MLHDAANGGDHFVEGSDERSLLPTPGVAFDADTICARAQTGESHPIVVLGFSARRFGIGPPEDQMLAMNPNRHTDGDGVVFDELGQLPMGTLHR